MHEDVNYMFSDSVKFLHLCDKTSVIFAEVITVIC